MKISYLASVIVSLSCCSTILLLSAGCTSKPVLKEVSKDSKEKPINSVEKAAELKKKHSKNL